MQRGALQQRNFSLAACFPGGDIRGGFLIDVHAQITTDADKVVRGGKTVPVKSRAGAVLAKIALLSRQL